MDLKFAQFKKVNIFAGRAFDEALSKKEAKTLIRVWSKQRKSPWRLNVQEVTMLVEFTDRILDWRRNIQREFTRLRVEKLRKKLGDAVENGDANAIRKVEKIRKAKALRYKKYRKDMRKRTVTSK